MSEFARSAAASRGHPSEGRCWRLEHELLDHRMGREERNRAMIAWTIWDGRVGQLTNSSVSAASPQP